MADLTWISVELVEERGRPENSPIWRGSDGRVRIELAQNVETGVYTAIVRIPGCPASASENTDSDAALGAAVLGFATAPNRGPRLRDLTTQDRAEVAALAARAMPTRGRR